MSESGSHRPAAVLTAERGSVSRNSVALSAAEGLAARDAAAAGTRASIRASGRYSQSSNHRTSQSSNHRHSRASLARGSVLAGGGTRGTTALDSSGIPFERILCIDPEDGRDRTPKPLVAARPHGAAEVAAAWGSSDGPGIYGADASASGSRLSVMSFGGPLLPCSIPSVHSFLGSEAGDASVDGGLDSGRLMSAGRRGRQSTMHHSGAPAGRPAPGTGANEVQQQHQQAVDGNVGKAEPASSGFLELGRGEVPEQQHRQERQRREQLRSKATQCRPVALASRGVQVLPWELRDGAGAEEAEEAAAATHRDGAVGDAGDEDDALLAMMQQTAAAEAGSHSGRGGGGESHRASPTPSSHGLRSQASSRRESAAGSARMSTAHGTSEWDASRRSSMQSTNDWSARDSVAGSTRTSYAAFAADGRASTVSSVAGWYPHAGGGGTANGRGSVMSLGGQQQRRGSAISHSGHSQAQPPPPQPSPTEVLAREQRRQKAEQEKALARLPGLLQRLQVAERAVLLNLQHPQLARYGDVQLCRCPQDAARGVGLDADGGTGAADGAQPSAGGALHSELDGSTEAGEGSAQSAAAEQAPVDASAVSSPLHTSRPGGGTPLGTSRPGAASELQLLWSWRSELAGELPVSCLAFNRAAPGLVAVGYGRLEYGVLGAGLVAVWSLANPAHPLWHAATPCCVSALDWSGKAPACLAVGFFDGSLALYDVRSRAAAGGSSGAPKPLARAPPARPGGATGGHSEPVWRLRHVARASDPGEEMLVSVSSDGWVLEWKHAQGLERGELLRLKRQQGAAAAAARQGLHGAGASRESGSAKEGGVVSATEGYLGRAVGATCFDFSPADTRTYLVGTEDGTVHGCSTAFAEQAVQTYTGHLAPLYQVCWSPFSPTHFLTASADWSVRLWADGQPHSLRTFQLPGAKAEVADAAFCPAAATLFAAVAGNTLQLWDLERSVLAPRATATRFGVRLTALAFSQAGGRDAPAVAVGADDGAVSVYSLAGMYDPAAAADDAAREEQRQRLEAALRLHTAQHTSD